MQWIMKCSQCKATFEVEVGMSYIFRRKDDAGVKTPCPNCGNKAFNRILKVRERGGKERAF